MSYIERSYIRKMAMLEMAYTMETETDAAVVLRMIEDAPAADVAPVRHSMWKRNEPLLECQCCGEIYSQFGGNAGKAWDYCPSCGCKMDLNDA